MTVARLLSHATARSHYGALARALTNGNTWGWEKLALVLEVETWSPVAAAPLTSSRTFLTSPKHRLAIYEME